jgi:hypothetical protein
MRRSRPATCQGRSMPIRNPAEYHPDSFAEVPRNSNSKMPGLIGFAPVYLNGLLAIFFVFILPGMVFVRVLDIPSFPQRWFVVFLSSLTANHFVVTLIAELHLDPSETYRVASVVLVAALLVLTAMKRVSRTRRLEGASIVLLSDLKWLLGSVAVLCLAYFNVWKHGVPNIFQGGDVSVSWNVWSLIWSQGLFPTASYGYPQFVPTIWAVTYIFIGSIEQYFAFYIYLVWIIAPIVLSATVLGRVSRLHPLPLLLFVWFVAEIREPWLKSTLEEGFPDWVAAIFGFCGAVLFVVSAPQGKFDSEKIITALVSLCLVSIAAATKPIYGLFAIAILIGICADAVKYLDRRERNRLMIAAIGIVSLFVAAYAINYSHLEVRSMPNYPVPELSERLSRAAKLLNSNFTLPFRILIFFGLALSPFLPRIRWLALPLLIGSWLWANTASYDLRNLLGLLLISAFIPVYAAIRALPTTRVSPGERQWSVSDGGVAIGLAILSVGLTLTLAQGDKELKQRFANDQLRGGLGFEMNQAIGQLLVRGCRVFSTDGYIATIAAFQPFRSQVQFFHFTEPLTDALAKQLPESTGCTSILYPPDRTHPSILSFVAAYIKARGFTKMTEGRGMTLLVSSPSP